MSQKKISGIYKITNKLNGKHYIGVSINIMSRWSNHRNLNSERISHIKAAIKKYGLESFEFSIVEECHKDLFEERERHWIAFYDSMMNGYNLTAGGNIRKELSEKTRKQMSEKSKGVPKSKEHIAKICATNRTERVRSIISQKLTGRKLSDETKAKMSASKKGHPVSKESIEKMKANRKTWAISEQTKKKMSEARLAYFKRKALELGQSPPKEKHGTERVNVDSPSRD